VGLSQAAFDPGRANNLTHSLYRYPASMSPMIARSLIENFSRKGDLLLDPFCGGGTTAIEGIALGREVVCSDISPLACFVTKAKATPISNASLTTFHFWYQKETKILKNYNPRKLESLEINGGKYSPVTYTRILKLMKDTKKITDPAARRLAQLVVLNVAKRSFDCRSKYSPRYLVRQMFQKVSNETTISMRKYMSSLMDNGVNNINNKLFKVIQCDAKKLRTKISSFKNKISLVVTSPPYPGVHVLYNRWQLFGRKETDMPFRLLGFDNSCFASFYTMGIRSNHSMIESYLENMRAILASLYELLAPGGIIAQVIAFPRNDGHFNEYSELTKEVGFSPVKPGAPVIKRHVPNRKWYARVVNNCKQPIEYIFIHQKK
jgi:DNA modification methylase